MVPRLQSTVLQISAAHRGRRTCGGPALCGPDAARSCAGHVGELLRLPTPEQYREARRLLGWDLADLALAAATTSAMVSRIETGFGVTPQVRANVNAALAASGIRFEGGRVRLVEDAGPDRDGPRLCISGDQVRLARQLLGWNQTRLAAAAGIGKSTLGSLEIGDTVKPATVTSVMAALAAAGVTVDAKGQVTLRPGATEA